MSLLEFFKLYEENFSQEKPILNKKALKNGVVWDSTVYSQEFLTNLISKKEDIIMKLTPIYPKRGKGSDPEISKKVRLSIQKHGKNSRMVVFYIGKEFGKKYNWSNKDKLTPYLITEYPRMVVLERNTTDPRKCFALSAPDANGRTWNVLRLQFTYEPPFPYTDKMVTLKVVKEEFGKVYFEVPVE